MTSGYVELHCHSGFSFLDGASSPDDLAAAAAAQGHEALAITDHDGVWGAMEFAVGLPAAGSAPNRGRRAHRGAPGARHACSAPPVPPDAPGRVGRGVAEPLPAPHRGARPHAAGEYQRAAGCPSPFIAPLVPRTAHRRTRLPLGLRSRRRAGRHLRARGRRCPPAPTRPRRLRWASAWCARSGATASGSSSSGPSGDTTWRATAGSRAWRSAWGCRASPRATCTRTIRRGRRSRMRWWRSGWARRSTRRGRSGEATRALVLRPPAEMARRFAGYPDAVAESGRLAERLRFNLLSDHGYRYPGAEDPKTPTASWRSCARRASRAATPARPSAGRRSGAWRTSSG